MMHGTIRQRGESWQADYLNEHGKRVRKSFRSEAEARAHIETYGYVAGGAHRSALHTLHDAYIHTRKERWDHMSSARGLTRNAEFALEYFGNDCLLKAITSADLKNYRSYLEDTGISSATINRKLSALSAMLTEAAEEGAIPAVPKIRRMTERGARVRYLTDDEQSKIIRFLRQGGWHTAADLVIFLADTGLRVAKECLPLTLHDICTVKSQEGGLQRLAVSVIGKGSKPRKVPLTRASESIVRKYMEEAKAEGRERIFPIDYEQLRAQFDKARFALRMDDVVLHTLRHTCASRLVQRNVDLIRVQEWMGHKTLLTTRRYAHLAAHHLMDAAEALD